MMSDLPGYLSKDITGLREESVTDTAQPCKSEGIWFGECVAVSAEKYNSGVRAIGDKLVSPERIA